MSLHSYTGDFESFEGHAWLNTASEGPLPKVAAKALKESIEWKSRPYLLDGEKFTNVPKGLKESIGRLIGVSPRDVILGNSASYGIHILANGYPFSLGDEVILMQNDFPTDILPWLALEKKGVRVKQVPAADHMITPQEVEPHISGKTKFICLSHVHTFSGAVLDVEGFGRLCREHGVYFVLNLSQSAGNCPLDLGQWPVDAAVCAGYKWLCGPYGTGFAWIRPELRERLDLNLNYWIASMGPEDLKHEGALEYKPQLSARKFDVFGTANFFNFVPWRASIEYLLGIGIDEVFRHNQIIIDHLLAGLSRTQYHVINGGEGRKRSNLVVFSHAHVPQNEKIFRELTGRNIHLAFWKNRLRVSPHVHNTIEDIDRLVDALTDLF